MQYKKLLYTFCGIIIFVSSISLATNNVSSGKAKLQDINYPVTFELNKPNNCSDYSFTCNSPGCFRNGSKWNVGLRALSQHAIKFVFLKLNGTDKTTYTIQIIDLDKFTNYDSTISVQWFMDSNCNIDLTNSFLDFDGISWFRLSDASNYYLSIIKQP